MHSSLLGILVLSIWASLICVAEIVPEEGPTKALYDVNVEALAKTEFLIVTLADHAIFVSTLLHSVALYVPALMGVTLVVEAKDAEVFKGIVPFNFPYPVKIVRVAANHSLLLHVYDSTEENCRSGHNRVGYVQQQLWSFYADKMSTFPSEYIMLAHSDFVFTNKQWIVHSLLSLDRRFAIRALPYTTLEPIYKSSYKPSVDFALNVNNEFEFMVSMPFLYEKGMFSRFRERIVAAHGDTRRVVDFVQKYYVDNRECGHDDPSIRAKFGVVANFNWLSAYMYHFENSKIAGSETAGFFGFHGTMLKRDGPVPFVMKMAEHLAEHRSCPAWYCSGDPVRIVSMPSDMTL